MNVHMKWTIMSDEKPAIPVEYENPLGIMEAGLGEVRSTGTDMPVTRCICHDLSFEQLKALAADDRLDFEQLQLKTRCGTACGMCEPYVRLMLITGETRFRVLNSASIRLTIAKHFKAQARAAQQTGSMASSSIAMSNGNESAA